MSLSPVSSQSYISNSDQDWPPISSTGGLRHVYRGSPTPATTPEEHEDLPYFTSTGVLRNAYRQPPSPAFAFECPGPSLATMGSPVAIPFDPFGDHDYPSRDDNDETSTATLDGRYTTNQGGSTPSLVNSNHSGGDASASPRLTCDTYNVTSIAKAVELIQGATTPSEAEDVVLAITSWFSSLAKPEQEKAKKDICFEMVMEFLAAWNPMRKDHFLNFDEHNVFVLKKWLPLTFMDPDVLKRFANTARSCAMCIITGGLVQSGILMGAHAVAACEILFGHYKKDGYLLGLYTLMKSTGDKLCESADFYRMEELASGLWDAKKTMDLYEVEEYADPITDMIRRYAEAQAIAHPQRGTKRKRE